MRDPDAPRRRRGDRAAGPASTAVAELALVGSIAAYHVLDHRVLDARYQLPAHAVAGVSAAAAARVLGADADELGLSPSHLVAGVRTGLLHGTVALAGLTAAAFVPALEPVLADPRAVRESKRDAAVYAVVEIPLGTALYEELVFRSALLGLAQRRWSRPRSVAITSVLFGLWHIFPAIEDRRHNKVAQRYAAVATIAPTVISTAVAGAMFSRLRFKANHVAAPILAHALFNTGAFLAAQIVHARRARTTVDESDDPSETRG